MLEGPYTTDRDWLYPELWEQCAGAWCPALGPSGTLLYDVTGGSNTGVMGFMAPATSWVFINGQWMLSFSGGSDNVDFGPSTFIQPTRTGSISIWFNYTATGGFRVIIANCSIDLSGGNGFGIYILGGKVSFTVTNASGFINTVGQSISLNTWYHEVLTWDGANVRQYHNGVLIETLAQTVSPTAGTYNTYLGRDAFTGHPYQGYIGETRIYTRALPPEEVAFLTLLGQGGPLLAHDEIYKGQSGRLLLERRRSMAT